MSADKIQKIRGAFYGHAFGSAYGAVPEILTSDVLADWNDDTDQVILAAETYIKLSRSSVSIEHDFARRLKRWSERGFKQLGDTYCSRIKDTTRQVCAHTDFLKKPLEVAHTEWKSGMLETAPVDAPMRGIVAGLAHMGTYTDLCVAAMSLCKVTSPDPRCLATCVFFAVVFSMAVGGESIPKCINAAAGFARQILSKQSPLWTSQLNDAISGQPVFRAPAKAESESSDISEEDEPEPAPEESHSETSLDFSTGDICMHTISSSMWALRRVVSGMSVVDAIQNVASGGGAVGSNCAASASVLGVFFGPAHFEPYLARLEHIDWLDKRISLFLNATRKIKTKPIKRSSGKQLKPISYVPTSSGAKPQPPRGSSAAAGREAQITKMTMVQKKEFNREAWDDCREISKKCRIPVTLKFVAADLAGLKPPSVKCNVRIIQVDSLTCAQELARHTPLVHVMCNGVNPGGEVSISGSQEEDIYRRSSIHLALPPNKGPQTHPLYPLGESVIYASGVSVHTNRFYKDCEEFVVNMILAAPTKADIIYSDRTPIYSTPESRNSMKSRIELIFKTAIKHGTEHLILGAFGCGGAGHPPHEVAKIFREVIVKWPVPNVHFAIGITPSSIRPPNKSNFIAFEKFFSENPI